MGAKVKGLNHFADPLFEIAETNQEK